MITKLKFKIVGGVMAVLLVIGLVLYFRYLFTYEQRQQLKRQIGSVTGMNLTVTIFGLDGRIIKRWTGVQKITSGRDVKGTGERNYTFFYTRDNKYVQIPDSVWYLAEEE
ncbi:MAG: hypothetical protein E4G96_05700 [Chrysiogenales bacterium]|nr:MAG: hypothetical protein E4G96_05700 [Chrysiogenales bacterium]